MIRKLTLIMILAALGLTAETASALFDEPTVNPRSRAMGETSVSVSDPAFAAFVNPGQLASVDMGAVSAAYTQPFGASFNDFFYLGAAIPLSEKWGNIGVGLSDYKVEFDGVTLQKETQLSVAHGFSLYHDMHSTINFGYALNLYSVEFGESTSGIDPGSDTVFGIDVGMDVTVHERTHIGFQVKNLSNPMIGLDQEELAKRLVAGVSYEPYDGVITSFEFNNQLGEDIQYRGGAEFVLVEGFALRAGVVTGPNKLTGGFGYNFQSFGLNYGFSTGGGVLDSTHHFGLEFAWGGEAK
ncbi:MAG: hypothetical protein ACI8S7_001688 [Candidatus Krumholzibacteriia bacterium]|jgi:hypothetical protein